MKKTLLIGAMASFLGLAACNGENLAQIIADVQAGTKTACAFVPTATTITEIVVNAAFPSATPVMDIVKSIVTQVCAVKMAHMNSLKAAHPGASPMVLIVNGKAVTIHGRDTTSGKSL
mgnify:CR=1 FL=1